MGVLYAFLLGLRYAGHVVNATLDRSLQPEHIAMQGVGCDSLSPPYCVTGRPLTCGDQVNPLMENSGQPIH